MSAEAKDRSVGQEERSAARQHDVEATSRPHAAANGPQAVPELPTLPPALPGIGNFSDRLRRGFAHANGADRADLLTRLRIKSFLAMDDAQRPTSRIGIGRPKRTYRPRNAPVSSEI